MAQNRLNGLLWNSEAVQIGAQASPRCMPPVPFRQSAIALEPVFGQDM